MISRPSLSPSWAFFQIAHVIIKGQALGLASISWHYKEIRVHTGNTTSKRQPSNRRAKMRVRYHDTDLEVP
jgi:hypothetical protein